MSAPYWINENEPSLEFPAVEHALVEPNGLLAIGGDLSPARLIQAYSQGIFPWFNDDQPILWWSPNPRAVLFPEQIHISRSLRKIMRQQQFRITLDQDFEAVIRQCAAPRQGQPGTWITDEMHDAYVTLHQMGVAHSVEAWQGEQLVGGLYGIALGKVFFGESMFSLTANASKVAFACLARQLQRWKFAVIDCQVSSEHLKSLGATEIDRKIFTELLKQNVTVGIHNHPWHFDEHFSVLEALPQ